MHRRQALLTAAGLAVATGARAQTWPVRPLRMVIPWPPGQATDLAGRVLAQKLSELLGQSVVADNRAGAGGMIGTDAVAKAAPDGYTILAGSSGPVTINPLVQRTAYDAERDMAPIAMIGRSGYTLVVRPGFPAADLAAFVALVKASPGKYTFASSGNGATAHLIAEWFNRRAGLDSLHIPYPGSVPALTAIVAGQVDYALETVAATGPLVRTGALRALGISFAGGSALAPGVPPIATAGGSLAGFDAGAWLGLMAPAGVPRPIVERLAAETARAMAIAEVRDRLASVGVEPDFRDAATFATHLKEQREVFTEIVRSANIRIE